MFKKCFSRLAIIIAMSLVISTSAFAEEVVIESEEEMALTSMDDIATKSTEEVIFDSADEVATSVNHDEQVPMLPIEDGDEDEATMSVAEASLMSVSTYPQPLFYTRSGFDAISVYLTDSTGAYTGKCYFVYNGTQWLLYNYKAETAALYFDKTESYSGLFIPSVKSSTRSDNANTSYIDESRIPVMTKDAFNGMYCNWRDFSDIPFSKDSNGNLIYAGGSNSGNSENSNSSSPSNSASWYRYTVSMNSGNTYRVYVTKSVSYNGKKHTYALTKSSKKKANDVQVYVYLNGELVDPKLYSVKVGNNKFVNGFKGEKYVPYVNLKFKSKALKADKKAMKKKRFGFNITPLNLQNGTLRARFKIKGGSTTLKNPRFTTKDGTTVKMSASDYKLSLNDQGNLIVTGVGNFTGSLAYSSGYGNSGNNSGLKTGIY